MSLEKLLILMTLEDFLFGTLPFKKILILYIFSIGENSMVYTDFIVPFKN